MTRPPQLPTSIAGILVPQDDVADATWRWAHRDNDLAGWLARSPWLDW